MSGVAPRRWGASLPVVAIALAVGVACGPPAPSVRPPAAQAGAGSQTPQAITRPSGPDEATFDHADLVGPVQAASVKLAGVVANPHHLRIGALHSPNGTAAVKLQEIAGEHDRWGRLMIPAERTIFRAFAADSSLGSVLVIEDDVRIHGGTDPVPLTGYRWLRADVEAYARCGIPAREFDGCTSAFYGTPQMWLVRVGNRPLGT